MIWRSNSSIQGKNRIRSRPILKMKSWFEGNPRYLEILVRWKSWFKFHAQRTMNRENGRTGIPGFQVSRFTIHSPESNGSLLRAMRALLKGSIGAPRGVFNTLKNPGYALSISSPRPSQRLSLRLSVLLRQPLDHLRPSQNLWATFERHSSKLRFKGR